MSLKVELGDIFDRCEDVGVWVPGLCTLAVDSAQKVEGKYSIKLTSYN